MGARARAEWRVWDLGNGTIMLQKLFNSIPNCKLLPILSSSRLFLSAFHFHQPLKFPGKNLSLKKVCRGKPRQSGDWTGVSFSFGFVLSSSWCVNTNDYTCCWVRNIIPSCSFILRKHCGIMVRSMVSAVKSGSNGQGSRCTRSTELCSWARHFTLTVPLSIQEYTRNKRFYFTTLFFANQS